MKDGRTKPKPAALSGRELLWQWISRQRMTQGEAADQIGITRTKLNQYLNLESRPSLETAIRIEDATGIGMRTWLIEEPATSSSKAEASGSNRQAGGPDAGR